MRLDFKKIHGLGNDFLVIGESSKTPFRSDSERADFAKKFCDRNRGVGADGVLFLQENRNADFFMRVANADGSFAETCVNGLRCAALFKHLEEKKKKGEFLIETMPGTVKATVENYSKGIAQVMVELPEKPKASQMKTLAIEQQKFDYYFVDVGNPHCVIFLEDDIREFPVKEIGHAVENHGLFAPKRTNTEFVNVVDDRHVHMRVYERGVGETAACGSGSIAVVAAGVKAGKLAKEQWIKVEQPGGVLEIKVGKSVFLKGAAEFVFEGKLQW